MGAYENILQYFNWSQTLTAGTVITLKKNNKKKQSKQKNYSDISLHVGC